MSEERARHRWGPPHRPTRFKTERQCERCGLVKVTRHEGDEHWTEFWGDGGLERVQSDKTPACQRAMATSSPV